MNALGDVAGMTETGPRKHHKGLWSCGDGQLNCGKCCSLVACKMTAVSSWRVQKTLEVHSAWAHQLEKTGSTTSEGTRLVCSVEEIGSPFHVQLLQRMRGCVLLAQEVAAENMV